MFYPVIKRFKATVYREDYCLNFSNAVDYLLTLMHSLYFSEIPKSTCTSPLFLHFAVRTLVIYEYSHENKIGNDPERPQIWCD